MSDGAAPGTRAAVPVSREAIAAQRAAPAWPLRVASVWARHLRVYSDSFAANATPAVFEPLFLLMAVGLGVGRYIDQRFNGLPYDQFMAPGILGMTAVYTAAYEATYGTYVRMRFQRTYQAMLATPLTARDVVLGELVWCGSKGLLFCSIVVAVLAALGTVTSWWALAVPVAGFLTATAFGGLSLTVTSFVRNMNHFQFFFTAALTPLVFFSGLMFPVQDLPGALPWVAYSLPMFHVIETFRLLTSGAGHLSVPWAVWSPLVLLASAALLGWLGVYRMRRRLTAA
jgi:lipooligosaccharide transport system permease protein